MATIQRNPALTPQEMELFDDILDIVREERRGRLFFGGEISDPYAQYQLLVNWLKSIAEKPEKILLKEGYLIIAQAGQNVIDEGRYQHEQAGKTKQ